MEELKVQWRIDMTLKLIGNYHPEEIKSIIKELELVVFPE